MKKIQKHIEIIRSNEPWLSSLSQESCDAIENLLKRNYAVVGVSIVNNLVDLKSLVSKKPDLVFMGMKFLPVNPALGLADPDKIWIAEFLDERGIAYTGSNQLAHELELNKHLSKQRVQDLGFNTSPFRVVCQGQKLSRVDIALEFPLFIKPTSRGGGLGIDGDSVAHNFKAMQSKVQSINSELRADSLLEEYLPGREFSVAILKDEYSTKLTAMPIELITSINSQGDRILSEEVKSSNLEVACPIQDTELRAQIVNLSVGVFNALGARDYGRIDVRMDKNGTPHFLEANLIPSLISGYGSFPKACVINIGMDYSEMVLSIVRLGLARAPIRTGQVTEPALSALFRPVIATNPV